MNRDIKALVPKLPADLDLIVGIPRSGLLAASLLALYLNLPITDIDGLCEKRVLETGLYRKFGKVFDFSRCKKVLVIDDSINSGATIEKAKSAIQHANLPYKIYYTAIYVTSTSQEFVDFWCEVVDQPRYFEWNVMHHPNLKRSCVDLDGILCRDPTESENDDGDKYRSFLVSAEPLIIPSVEIGWIVTCRLEKYRHLTEEWLKKHGIRYTNLAMMDLPDKKTRLDLGKHALFKAEVYKSSHTILFIESSPVQAQEIAARSGKDVLCLNPSSIAANRDPKIAALIADLRNSLSANIQSLELQIQQRDLQIQFAESQMRRLESQIQQIQQSIPMQLVNRYQRIVGKLLRPGTRRRRCYELGLSGIRIILSEGWRSFWARFKEWALENRRLTFKLLWWRASEQFSRADNALLSFYQRFVPMRIKKMIPDRLKEVMKRRLVANFAPVTIDMSKIYPGAPFDEPVFGPQLLPDWSEKSEILRALCSKGSKGGEALEELPTKVHKMAQHTLARKALKVSVIMATWNGENVVADAIESALNQSYPPAEVIVVDDGSEDRTCEVLQERFGNQLASGQLKILSQAHKGASAARNAGLASANGDLIAYLDSDNTWHRDYLLTMTAIFAGCDEVATAYATLRCHALDEQRTFVGATPYDRRTLLDENFIDLNAFMHRRFVYLQNGGFDESSCGLAVWDFIISYTHLYPPAFVPLIGAEQSIDGKGSGSLNKTVDLDQNRQLVLRKHWAERIRYGLEGLRLAYILWDWPALSQTFVINEIRWLIQQGQDVKVYYKTGPDRAAKLDFKVEAYRVRDAQHLAELLVAHDRTFCHAHFAYPATTLLAWPACEATGMPFTFFVHAVDIFRHDNRERNRVADVVRSANCKKVFAYGEYHRAFLEEQGVPAEKIALNFQAVDLDLYKQIAPIAPSTGNTPLKGIFIGRFVEKKGVDILLEAAAILHDEPVTFELYGYGRLEARYRQRAVELGLDNIKFMGPIQHRQDLARVYQSADFLVVPSVVAANGDTEGFPTIIPEAMAAGRPVITSAVSAIPDFLRDMVEAILVEPKSPEALASGVRRLLAMTPERRAAMNFEARRFLHQRIGLDKTMQVYLDTWRNNPVDIFLVTFNTARYNHRGETMEIVERVLQHTTTPYTLTIVDNGSDYEFRKMLIEMTTDQPQVRLILKEENLFCGPASNIALEYGDAPLAIYLCSNEAFVGRHGWERPLIDHMREHPEEVLAGTRVHLPKYTLGKELVAYPAFGKFRNPEFALRHPDRPFTHVQGGVFILRRQAVALYGGFSSAIPQGGTDVEFSYFLESAGARLGSVPQVASVTVKTLPGLPDMVDEFTSVAHPLTRDTVRSILDGRKRVLSGICNICGEPLRLPASGAIASDRCAKCGSTPFGRTIYRRLANDWRTHRRGRAVLVTPDRALGSALGKRMFHPAHAPGDVEAACAELVKTQGTTSLVVIDPDCVADKLEYFWDAALSALRPDGLLLYTDGRTEAFVNDAPPPTLLDAALKRHGWSIRPSFPEARLSRTLRLDWRRLFEIEAPNEPLRHGNDAKR
ncbi:MAG: glycosyltransferase [Promethearchaeota archaeon]